MSAYKKELSGVNISNDQQAMHVTHLEKHLPEDDNGNLYMVAPIQARGIESKMGWLANTRGGPRATDYNNSSSLIINWDGEDDDIW